MENELDAVISSVLLSTYRAAREVPLEDFAVTVFDLLRDALPFETGRWGIGTMTETGVVPHAEYLYREPLEMIPAYAEIKHQDVIAKTAVSRPNGTFSGTTSKIFAGKAMAGIRSYTQYFDHRNTLIGTHTDPRSRLMHWLSFYRASEQAVFSARDRKLVSLLLPHLREAMVINHTVHMHDDVNSECNEWACAIADPLGTIHFAGPDFLEFAKEDDLISDGRMHTEAIEGLLQFKRFMNGRVVIVARQRAGFLFLKARAIRETDRLTLREMEVAQLAGQAMSHKEIAKRLELSPATVRTHIQRIHAKLETHSVVQIANLLKGREIPSALPSAGRVAGASPGDGSDTRLTK